ncbi:MAG: hypothetical protein IPM89_14810 [Candidatus Competibacteraceae bacterium]|nr:MAG: hypothetical protein IPM89_14810 [Candidatus Competibacteraceae bacterium]
MPNPWSRLSEADVRQLGGALQAGRLRLPFSTVGPQRYLAAENIRAVVAVLDSASRSGHAGTAGKIDDVSLIS